MKFSLTRIILAASGLGYTLIGLAQLFAPQWFFINIGNFAPYNRHYIGDLGAFTLPLGLGLLWAARAPRTQRGLIAVIAIGSTLHALNHLYDNVATGGLMLDAQTLALFVFALLLGLVWWRPEA